MSLSLMSGERSTRNNGTQCSNPCFDALRSAPTAQQVGVPLAYGYRDGYLALVMPLGPQLARQPAAWQSLVYKLLCEVPTTNQQRRTQARVEQLRKSGICYPPPYNLQWSRALSRLAKGSIGVEFQAPARQRRSDPLTSCALGHLTGEVDRRMVLVSSERHSVPTPHLEQLTCTSRCRLLSLPASASTVTALPSLVRRLLIALNGFLVRFIRRTFTCAAVHAQTEPCTLPLIGDLVFWPRA